MNYKTAIYTKDYLTLLELTGKLEEELPSMEITIFGPESLEKDLSEGSESYINTDLSRISEADILILASEPEKPFREISEFDGTIIDCVGYKFPDGAEVFRAEEPIGALFKNLAVPAESVSAVVQLPVCIFGKDGVEDLMRQTKDVFTFENGRNLIFDDRIAFNTHFNPTYLAGLPVGASVDDFADAGGDIGVRISPLSTVFIADVFAPEPFGLKSEEGYTPVSGFFTAAQLSERDDIVVLPRRNGFTFAGDYIRVYIKTIISLLKEAAQ